MRTGPPKWITFTSSSERYSSSALGDGLCVGLIESGCRRYVDPNAIVLP